MNAKKFSNALGEVNDKYVSEAIQYKAKKKKPVWLKWGAMAACLCLMVMAAIPIVNHFTADPATPDDEVMIKSEYLDIYFVSENGTMESSNVYVRCTAENIFAEWAKLNNVTDVLLIECKNDNGGTTTIKGDPNDPEAPVEHQGGDKTTLTLVVSKEFSRYAEAENGELLVEALEKTFYAYSAFDTFELVIQK